MRTRRDPIRPCTSRVALALLGLAAASGAAPALAQQAAATRQASLTPEQLEALYVARRDSALTRFTPADVGFMAGMIHHHAQAIVMSQLAPTHGASAEVQTLAARIINAQQDEIGRMQRWLADRGQPVPQVSIDGLDLVVETRVPDGAAGHEARAMGEHAMAGQHADHANADPHAEHALMPGMLTRAQLEALDAARGPEFDRLFLQGMIHHHGGAVTMVHELFATDGAAQDATVFKFASDVQVDQTTEIARMQRMLDAREAGR